MDLGDGEVEHVRDHGYIELIDVPELFLDRMQDRYQRTPQTAQLGGDLGHTIGAPGDREGRRGRDFGSHMSTVPGGYSTVKANLPMTR